MNFFNLIILLFHLPHSVQFSSLAQSCWTLCDPKNRSTPGLPVDHQLLFTQTHVHCVGDAVQPSHPLSSPSLPSVSLIWVSSQASVLYSLSICSMGVAYKVDAIKVIILISNQHFLKELFPELQPVMHKQVKDARCEIMGLE